MIERERVTGPKPNGIGSHAEKAAPALRLSRWVALAVWLATFGWLAAVVAFGRATVQLPGGFGVEESIPTVLRRFDASLTTTGWGDTARIALWTTGALALVAAAVYLWLVLSPPDADS